MIFQQHDPAGSRGLRFGGAALLAMFIACRWRHLNQGGPDVGATCSQKVGARAYRRRHAQRGDHRENVGDNVGDCAGMAADMFRFLRR